MKKSIFFVLLLSLFFIGCNADDLVPMPSRDDYSYTINDKYEVSRANPRSIVLSNISTREIIIESKISRIGWDENFILINQVNPYDRGTANTTNEDISYKTKLKTPPDGSSFYWIINCKDAKCYGPFSSDSEFNKNRTDLNVSSKIELKDVNSYKNNY